jgi:CTP:molybdopterin cytidylyltransferase MocA
MPSWTSRPPPVADAVVLAAGINTIRLFEGYEPGCKALLSFAGKTSVQFVLDALAAVPQVRRTCLIGPVSALRAAIRDDWKYELLPSRKTMSENIALGLEHFCGSARVLVVTADLPLITPCAVSDFLTLASARPTRFPTSIFWSAVPEEYFAGPFRGFSKGFNRFRDVSVCHGNLLMMNSRLLRHESVLECIEVAYRRRKSSLGVAFSAGWEAGFGYLLGVHLLRALTLEQMAGLVSSRLGVDIVPVLSSHPELAIDIDERRDYAFVRSLLEGADDDRRAAQSG